jgi:hypothetical protein
MERRPIGVVHVLCRDPVQSLPDERLNEGVFVVFDTDGEVSHTRGSCLAGPRKPSVSACWTPRT